MLLQYYYVLCWMVSQSGAHREDPVSRILSGGGVWHKINLSKRKMPSTSVTLKWDAFESTSAFVTVCCIEQKYFYVLRM